MSRVTTSILLGTGGALILYAGLRKKRGKVYPVTYPKLQPFVQNRVRRDDYGTLPADSPLLVPVESSGRPQKLHVLAAKRLDALKRAAARDGFTDIKVASGWRPHLWRDYNHYEQTMINRYGSVAEGRKWVAYKSADETGLAVDFGSHGLEPRRATNERQKQTPFYQWLVNNAHRFGFTPYKVEAWQWEVKVPRDAWASGEEFTNDYGVFV